MSRDHLVKYYANHRLVESTSTHKLCMYCDFEWNHPYQYKDHLRERHPNLDPDAVLGEAPGLQRRDKIIARVQTQEHSYREVINPKLNVRYFL